LLRVLAAGAWRAGQYRPGAIWARRYRFAQHAAHQRTAAPAAARTSADTSAFTHLLEGLGAALDSFDDRAFANLIAQTGRFEVLDYRLSFGVLF
jgi:hypothetical protein